MDIKQKIGSKLKVTTKKQTYEGILMPRSELADEEHIVVKLSSGYNVGISKKDIVKVQKLSGGKIKPKSLEVKFSKDKPPVSLISTGGTISSKIDYKTGGVFPYSKPEELLADVPELGNFARVKNILQPFQLLSEDMSSPDWAKIAKEVYKELNSDSEGVIVTHGTDTLHYTAAALAFMLKNLNKPVAVIGAQRSTDRGSFDGALNLVCGAHYCLSDIAEVSIVMHGSTDDEYCIASRGTKVRKMHSSRRDAFRPINEQPLAKIFPDGNVVMLNAEHKQRSNSKPELDTKFNDKVALVYSYPGSHSEVLDYYASKGYKGIIIAGTGFGHVSTQPIDKKFSWLPALKRTVDKGVFVGVTTQTLYGTTDPLVYSAGRLMKDAGAVFLKDMLPEVAYVKLGFVLGHTNKKEEIKKQMLTNFAGEINPRIDPNAFLY
jgi:glutamyl-tRNA(Gln) amidotransferase subunit D